MDRFKTIEPKDMDKSVFEMVGKDWMLITAKNGEKVNTMTASWGGMGVLWGSDVVYIFVRKSRYTKEFIDASDSFSLCFFDTEKYRKTLSYLGSVSGREEDKITKAGLTVTEQDDVPFFAEAKTTILCKKMGRFFIDPEGILDQSLVERWYADQDYHDLYVGRIEQVIEKSES